jgi:hypothetical protein
MIIRLLINLDSLFIRCCSMVVMMHGLVAAAVQQNSSSQNRPSHHRSDVSVFIRSLRAQIIQGTATNDDCEDGRKADSIPISLNCIFAFFVFAAQFSVLAMHFFDRTQDLGKTEYRKDIWRNRMPNRNSFCKSVLFLFVITVLILPRTGCPAFTTEILKCYGRQTPKAEGVRNLRCPVFNAPSKEATQSRERKSQKLTGVAISIAETHTPRIFTEKFRFSAGDLPGFLGQATVRPPR